MTFKIAVRWQTEAATALLSVSSLSDICVPANADAKLQNPEQ
jgi:hypothetical protein